MLGEIVTTPRAFMRNLPNGGLQSVFKFTNRVRRIVTLQRRVGIERTQRIIRSSTVFVIAGCNSKARWGVGTYSFWPAVRIPRDKESDREETVAAE